MDAAGSLNVYNRAPAGAFSPRRAWQFEEAIASWARPAKLELIEPRSPSRELWGTRYCSRTTYSGQHQYLSH